MKKTLPNIRIEDKDFENMKSAISFFNQNNIVSLSEAGFRRLAYKILSQMILTGEEIPLKFK